MVVSIINLMMLKTILEIIKKFKKIGKDFWFRTMQLYLPRLSIHNKIISCHPCEVIGSDQ